MRETLFFRFNGKKIEWVVLGQDGQRLEEGLSGVDLFNSRFSGTYDGFIVFVVEVTWLNFSSHSQGTRCTWSIGL